MKVYLINAETLEYPIFLGDFKLKFPETSFPENFEPDQPYFWVYDSPYPENIEFSEGVREGTPTFADDGLWYRNWEVYTLSEEEFLDKQNRFANNNKTKAMKLLSETDWTQISDVVLQNAEDFKSYRALLRNIAIYPPNHPIDFPVKPEEVW